ncbi:MAG: sulfotransferase domain-containing protein [Cyclobacteriaceae bacterium]
MSEQPTIYFHVGLGKVASTYLQTEVFPKLQGIHYISTHRYKKSTEIIPRLDAKKTLVSREFDRQLEEEVRWFTTSYPQARIIMVLRRHDHWIASQYKRHVKNGYYHPFESFLDLVNDHGYWGKKELNYSAKWEIIEECCEHAPLVLYYDDLKNDPQRFLNDLTSYLGVEKPTNISTRVVHRSFEEKQLKVLRSFCRKFIRVVPTNHTNKWKHWLLYRPVWLCYHLILYVSLLIPDFLVSNEPLIPQESLDQVRKEFDEDWKAMKAKSKE